MPRLSTSLIRRAYHLDPFLPLLLRSCRDLPSAQNELRWLREHVVATSRTLRPQHVSRKTAPSLYRACLQRSRGKPLQYILGNQPFGDLDILCKPGVLIPRPETETYTTFLAWTLIKHTKASPLLCLRILDLCSGTGCISLQLQALLSTHVSDLSIRGVDISTKALMLARKNLYWNLSHGLLDRKAEAQVRFLYGDVLNDQAVVEGGWDILISNPPYISSSSFNKDTSRSVRNYEPRLALVPQQSSMSIEHQRSVGEGSEEDGDIFYSSLIKIAQTSDAKIMVLEVADFAQAERVLKLVRDETDCFWAGAEIWHDDIQARDIDDSIPAGRISCDLPGGDEEPFRYSILGSRNARAVVCWRGEGQGWLGR